MGIFRWFCHHWSVAYVQIPHCLFSKFDPGVYNRVSLTIKTFWINPCCSMQCIRPSHISPLFTRDLICMVLFCWFPLFSLLWFVLSCDDASPSFRRMTRSCRGLVWPRWLHCPRVGPTKARARTPLTSTSAPRKPCRSAGLIPFLRNYWSTWRKVEGPTCALSAPSCSASQGRDLPSVPQGPRPPCEHKHGHETESHVDLVGWQHKVHQPLVVWQRSITIKGSRIYKQTRFHAHPPPRWAHHVHFLWTTL